ncbi:glycosyltransferase family 2 protein [Kosakonia sp. LAM2021]|uniref:glycosyltransferase family 2 protein n=1 Tax=Kosakonia sp. LAM2021 TaxID=2800475 RepID=UPI00190E1366
MEINNKIILFIPCYNCQDQIPRVLNSLKENDNYKKFAEILIIDNRSSDRTVEKSISAVKSLELYNAAVYTNSTNVGLGGTHKMAFRHAQQVNATHIAVLHGDDQGNINDLISLIDSQQINVYDCCLGSRFSHDSRLMGYAKLRIFGNYIFNLIYSVCSFHLVKDLGAGLNIYQVPAIADARILKFSNDLTFNCFLLLYSISQKQKIRYFPVEWREDDQISNVKLFSQAIRTLKIAVNYLFNGLNGLMAIGDNTIDFDNVSLEEKYKWNNSND